LFIPSGLEQQFTCFEQTSRPQAFNHHVGTLSSPRTFDTHPDFPGLARKSLPTTVEPKTKPVAMLATNQTADMSLPHDWLDLILPLSPQRTTSSTTQRNMESSEQTPATQVFPQPPATEMSKSTSSPHEEITSLNALLIDPTPLAFLETVAPDNAFASMNAHAAILVAMPILPEIPPSVSRALIKDLRDGNRTTNTSIINDLAITAIENATATPNACIDLKKYDEYLGKQMEEIPPLIIAIDTLATKLATITSNDDEETNLLFQHKLALTKLSGDLTKTKEAIPGLSLNATARHHQAVRKAMLRNFRYITLAWHSASEIAAGATYPQLVDVSSTGYPIDCSRWVTASHDSIQECRAEGPSRHRPQEPFAMLPVTHQAFPLHCDTPLVTASGLTLFTPMACNPIVVEQHERVYLVIYGWSAATEVNLFTGLQQLPFDLLNTGSVKTQRSTQTDQESYMLRKEHDEYPVDFPHPS
jgi:hypothetical protein